MKKFKEFYAESSAEYAKSLAKIANDKKLKSISKKDRETLMKIYDLLNKEKAEEAKEDLDEAPLVANITVLIKKLTKDLSVELDTAFRKGNMEYINNIARLVGKKLTTTAQQKGKAFMTDIKKMPTA